MRLAVVTLTLFFSLPTIAASSGVLLGLRDGDNHYRTLWIVMENHAPTVAVSAKGLVVPRETGLWRLDVERVTCGDMGQYWVDELHISALDSSSSAPATLDCEAVAKAACGDVYGLGLASARWISYAGRTHFAEAFRSVARCDVHSLEKAGYTVHELDHPDREVRLEDAFGADGMSRLQKSARDALVCGTDDLDCIDSQDRYQMSESLGWGIVRTASRWNVVVGLSPPESSGLAPSPVVTAVRPPVTVVGTTGDEAVSVEGLPEGDRFVSPDRDLALVRSERTLVYPLVAGRVAGPSTPIATRNDEEVVMVEWASPSEMGLWSAALEGLSHPSPASQSTGIDRVAWLGGCWEFKSEDRVVEEQWMQPRGKSMLGVSRTVRDGALADYELMVLREEGPGLVFEAHPSGLSRVAFAATTIGEQGVVFENPQHDFPQRIGYQRQGEGLLSWIEGTQNGEVRRFEFPYSRAACAGE